jgi:hypothetical protein
MKLPPNFIDALNAIIPGEIILNNYTNYIIFF